MTKIISGLLCLLMFSANILAQPNVLYSSNSFPEPVDGWKQLLILKNGNTCYLHLTARDIQVTIYGTDGKSISITNNTYTNYTKGKSLFKDGRFIDMFEVNGNITLFATCETGTNDLYRFIIDGNTGKLTDGAPIATLDKIKGYGYELEEIVTNDIYIKHDKMSDFYCILMFNAYNIKADTTIQLFVFDNTHQGVKKVTLKEYPGAKDVKYCGLEMHNKNIYLFTNEYNHKEKKSLAIPLKLSVLKHEATEFETKTITVRPFAINSENRLVYNNTLNTLLLFTTTETDSKYKYNLKGGTFKKSYATIITQIDPVTFTVISSKPYTGSTANTYARTRLKLKDGFNGVFPAIHKNKDNTITMIPEEQHEVTYSTGRGGTATTTYVDKIALVNLNSEGKEEDATVLRIREVSGARTIGKASGRYYEYKYANTGKSSYIIMNDLDENFDKAPESKLHAITSISDANTILYSIKNGSVQKSYMFGKPDNKKATRFSMVGDATFDEATNTYATIVVNGENKQARIAWVKFD